MQRVILLLAVALLVSPAIQAIPGAVDTVPAATLLFPYFEVDLSSPDGADTVLSIVNASASAAVVNVAVWTDRSVEVAHFPLYLTGFDAQRISLRDVLVHGILPATGDDADDMGDTSNPADGISNQGPWSQDINFHGVCGPLPNLKAEQLASIQAALVGDFSPLLGGCAGSRQNDGVARGYVTVDSIVTCEPVPHTDPTYFTELIDFRNILLGEYEIVNPSADREEAFNAVHIEAAYTDPLLNTPGRYTFYGRFNGFSAADRREPLGAKWATTYLSEGTELLSWRDSKTPGEVFPCGTVGDPLGQASIVVFDSEENPTHFTESLIRPFPEQSGKTLTGGAAFPVPHKMGWVYLNLNESSAASPTVPSTDPHARQSFVQVIHHPEFRGTQAPFTFGFTAVALSGIVNPDSYRGPGWYEWEQGQ